MVTFSMDDTISKFKDDFTYPTERDNDSTDVYIHKLELIPPIVDVSINGNTFLAVTEKGKVYQW